MVEEPGLAYQRRMFPALHELFVGYLNEDWDTLGDTFEAVVELFKTERPELIEQAHAEVTKLLELFPTEAQLAGVCQWWLAIDATLGDNQTHRQWFMWLSGLLEQV